MTIEQGSASSPVDLLTKLKDFASGLGWNVNYWETDQTLAGDLNNTKQNGLHSETGRGGDNSNAYLRLKKSGNFSMRYALRAVNYEEDNNGNTISKGNVVGGLPGSWEGIVALACDSFINDKGWRKKAKIHVPESKGVNYTENGAFVINNDFTESFEVGTDLEVTGRDSSSENGIFSVADVAYDSQDDLTYITPDISIDNSDDNGTVHNHLVANDLNPYVAVDNDQTGLPKEVGDRFLLAGSNTSNFPKNNGFYKIKDITYDSNNDKTHWVINDASAGDASEKNLLIQFFAWWEHQNTPKMNDKGYLQNWFNNAADNPLQNYQAPKRAYCSGIGLEKTDSQKLGSAVSYTFVGYTSPSDQIWVFYEYESGKYQWLVLGEIEPVNTNVSEGMVCAGTLYNSEDYLWTEGYAFDNSTIPFSGSEQTWSNNDGAGGSVIRVNEGGYDGWSANINESNQYGLGISGGTEYGQGECWGSNVMGREILRDTPNQFNDVHVLLPFNIYCGEGDQELFALLGHLPNVRWLNMEGIYPEDEITYGSEDWIVIPGFKKFDPDNEQYSFNRGIALKK